jgi:putative addiction module component (TIGR02574 family)
MTLCEQILKNALALPPEDRAFIVAALEQSLGVPDAIDAESPCAISGEELRTELQRRSEAYRTGATSNRSSSEVLDDQRRKQARGASG